MIVISKAQADKLLKESCGKLRRARYCNGKYNPSATMVGKAVAAVGGVVAIYPQRQSDRDGPYIRMMCLEETP